jgi:hypothetical protein
MPNNISIVSIVSEDDTDIHALAQQWNFETSMDTLKPFNVFRLNDQSVNLIYLTSVLKNLHINSYYNGNYSGTNLLSYLETKDTPFVMPLVVNDDALLAIITMFGLIVGSIIVGIAAVNSKK